MGPTRLDCLSAELFGQTPSQTIGPFFHYALPWKGGADLVHRSELGARPELIASGHDALTLAQERPPPSGELIDIVGRVIDGKGDPVPDAMVEIWQANAAGRYESPADLRDGIALDPNFPGFARSSTSEQGAYHFRTIRPGRITGPGNCLQAPHLALSIFGRGLLRRLATRLYFEDSEDNDGDPILCLVPAERRRTLIARCDGPGLWRMDIVLQGARETVFFDL
jgi:protocatechuate 3,4-dioxygenase alpha subunit